MDSICDEIWITQTGAEVFIFNVDKVLLNNKDKFILFPIRKLLMLYNVSKSPSKNNLISNE